jgi:Tol biopolymer transport system component
MALAALAAPLLFAADHSPAGDAPQPRPLPRESHLANLRQLTDGGQNAEAYWSFDGKQLVYQGFTAPGGCDQIFTMNADGSKKRLVSTGKGRCTCAYFTKDGARVLFSSTHEAGAECPLKPDHAQGYVWPVYDSYKIYLSDADGKHIQSLTPQNAYSAEATLSPDGHTIVFTSDRDGDLDLYTMDLDGKNVRRVTDLPGYDGGAFFSPDGKMLCFRGWHPTDPKELAEYRDLLKRHLVRPFNMEIFVVNPDGSGLRQVTHNGAANFCPYFTPDGKRIIFASNLGDPRGINFDLYLVSLDGTGLEQVTHDPTFDGFPMFSPDGTRLVWASNRNAKAEKETNIFIADWVENPKTVAPPALDVSTETVKRDVHFLASDEMKGRLTGSPEGQKAARYIADQFKAAGLQPLGPGGYFQPFEFTARVTLAPGNILGLASAKDRRTYIVEKDFSPLGFSDDGDLKGLPVVFAGYGIKAPDLQHDDYAGMDVKGKAVFIYRYGPEGDDPKSKYALYYPLRYKAMIAREAGAAALVVLSPDAKDDEVSKLKVDRGFGASGLTVLTARREVLDRWLSEAGKNLPDPKDPHGSPLGLEVPGVTLDVTVKLNREKASADNVVGWLPATRPTEETLVIGAHYDHLGMGIEGSLASQPGLVHPGADDNASGTAGVMELARGFAKVPARGRNLLFAAFGGEELGTLGSSFFVKNPIIPIKSMVAMFNMDMVGRLREGNLTVGGAGTSPEWKPLLALCNTEGLKLTLNEDGYGASDHSQFYAKSIPVLFFFTGAHTEYHRPEDKPETLDYPEEARVLRFVSRVAEGVLALPAAPPYAVAKSIGGQGAGRGFRVYLGTIPDYNEEVKGVRLMGVRAGSPAEKGGLKGGDTIVKLGDKKIENVYDYTYALQEHKADETVPIVVLRDGEEVTLQVTFARRASD